MGVNFRKSVKLGKNINLNIGKRGLGLSTGVKGARVSISKKGVRTSVGANGIRYTKNYSSRNIGKIDMPIDSNEINLNHADNIIKHTRSNSYTRHIKLILGGIALLFIGFMFPPLEFIAIILLLSGIVCMIKNWKRINEEYKIRKNIK